jgi:hypothetical protein
VQGRDARGQSANRGRGRNGRGGRGMARPPPRTGTVAAIEAYLDLVPGKEVNRGIVTNWVNKFRDHVVTICETSRINLIFGIDTTLGDYPQLQEPPLPKEDSTKFEIKKWEISYAKYIKDVDKLKADKLKVFGLMVEQISENSKNRIKETDAGAIAMEQQDPRIQLSAILSTHLTDNRLRAEHNLYKIEQALSRYVMELGDSLSFYYQRFRVLLSGVQEAYTRAKLEPPDTSYLGVQLALRFTTGLNSFYSPYKQYYEDGLKDWPESLVDAFSEASKFRPRTVGSGNPGDVGPANAFAIRDVDVLVRLEVELTWHRPGAPRGDRPNTAPGMVRVIRVESQATTYLSVRPVRMEIMRRLVLAQCSRTPPVTGRESKCIT